MEISDTLKKQDLIEKIKYLYETDVGDFKRKVTLYMNRFVEDQKQADLKEKLNDLKHKILYKELTQSNQIQDIDKLRFSLIEELQKLSF